MTIGYLAQPIDQGRRSPRITRVIGAARQLAQATSIDLFAPGRAYLTAGVPFPLSTSSFIDTINRQALDMADVLVAALPSGVPTLGTPVEIERALSDHKLVFIVTERALIATSVQLRSWMDSGAVLTSLESYEESPLENEALWREHIIRHAQEMPSVPQGRPADQLPYVRADLLSTVPTKAYEDDAGLDLAASADAAVPPGGRALVPTGLKFALPPGYWGFITGRSSSWAKLGLVVMPGVIDAGWRGELFVSLWNPGTEEVKIEIGQRLAQYILLPVWTGQLVEVGALPEHARGENGFGSSGR